MQPLKLLFNCSRVKTSSVDKQPTTDKPKKVASIKPKLAKKPKAPVTKTVIKAVPKPVSKPKAQPVGNIENIVRQAARKHGVDENFMVRIAQCESTMGQNIRNPSPVIVGGVNYGHAEGVFQFIPSTWERMSSQAGYGGRSVYDTEANINTAAWAFSTGHRGEWEC